MTVADKPDVRESIKSAASLNAPYLVMNALAAVVASFGLLQDSVAVVIGAMIIALLLGPISGIGLALVDGDMVLLRKAVIAEITGVAVVLTVGFTIGKLGIDMPLGSQIMSRTAPNILDLAIALAGGSAGAYATISPRLSAGLIGVAIATALVPPLCTCGICIAHGLYPEGGGAFLLFFTNLVAIQFATSLMLWLHGYHRLAGVAREQLVRRFAPTVLLLMGLIVFLGISFQRAAVKEGLRAKAEDILKARIESNGAAHLSDVRITNYKHDTYITAVVNAPWVVTPESCANLQVALRKATGRTDITLRVRSIITRECDESQYMWTDSSDTAPDGSPVVTPAASPAATPTASPAASPAGAPTTMEPVAVQPASTTH